MNRQSLPKFPREFSSQIRKVCKHYHNPDKMSSSVLAALALQAVLVTHPTHPTDDVGRTTALKQVIRTGLHQVEASTLNTHQRDIYLCLYSYIHQQDPLTGSSIERVVPYLQDHYGIGKTSYHKYQKQGLELLSYAVSNQLAQQTTWTELVPRTGHLVGRDRELIDYRRQLQNQHLAVIEGVGGIGKTTLAAQIADSFKSQQPVCWVTIRAGLNDTPLGLFYRWGAFLAQHGYPQLWAAMRARGEQQTHLNDFFPYLREGLVRVRPLLCLDNLEALSEHEKGFWSLLEMVREELGISLLLISQQRPPLAGLGDYPSLGGLCSADVQRFMQQRDIHLTPAQADTVTGNTLGNPRLLELWTAHMRLQGADMATSLAQLQRSQAASYFLSTEIMATLSTGQQRAAHLLALARRPLDGFLLQKWPDDLPSLSEFGIEPSDFAALHRLGIIDDQLGDQWTLSPLLQNHLLPQLCPPNMPPSNEVIEFHKWLARWYSSQGNTLEAAYHALQAEQREQVVLWLAEQQRLLIEQGHAAAMSKLLANIQAEQLSIPVRQVLRELRGNLWKLRGDFAAAEAEALEAAHEATTMAAQAQAERRRGELAKRRGHVWDAADHYQRALQLLGRKQATLDAWLHRELAWVLAEQNDLDEAKLEVQRARIALENTLARIAWGESKPDDALRHLEQGAAIAEEVGELRELARLRNNLALIYVQKGQIQKAIKIYQEILQNSQEIGHLVGQAIAQFQIGFCYTKLDLSEVPQAIDHLSTALPLFISLGDVTGQMMVHLNLVKQQLRLGNLHAARQHDDAALNIEPNRVPKRVYAKALRAHAELLLAEKELSAALTTAQQALDFLRVVGTSDTFSDVVEAVQAYYTLAKIYNACGKVNEAEKYILLAKALE